MFKKLFKKGGKVENIHTHEKCEIVAIEKVDGKVVYVLCDGSRWREDQFYGYWREVE